MSISDIAPCLFRVFFGFFFIEGVGWLVGFVVVVVVVVCCCFGGASRTQTRTQIKITNE